MNCNSAAVLLALIGLGFEAAGSGRNAGLLLYASFDKVGHTDLAPIQETHGRRGVLGRYPNANDAQGSRVLLNEQSLMIDDEGRFGEAVRLRAGPARNQYGTLVFDGKRNVNPRRGTICFWLKPWPRFSRVAGQRNGYLLWIGQQSWPQRVPALCVQVRGSNEFRFVAKDRDHSERQVRVGFKLDPFGVGQWIHLAFVWDETRGIRVYRDGEPIAGRWDEKATWHWDGVVDSLALGCMHMASRHESSRHDASYDELFVFERVLSADEIRRVVESNQPPTAERQDALPPERFEKHREEELGWHSPAGLPPVPADQTEAFLVQDLFVQKALAVKIDTRSPVDGKRMTAWPLEYHGYSFGKNRLDIDVGRPREANFARVTGSIAGKLLCGETEVATLKPMKPAGVHRVSFDMRKAQQWAIQRQAGRVTDLWLYHLTPNGGEMTAESRHELALSSAEPRSLPSAVETHLRCNYLPQDRLVVAAAPEAEPGERSVSRLRYWHVVLPAFESDVAVAGLTLDLRLQGYGPQTRVAISIPDSTTLLRRAFDFDLELAGERLHVCLDTQDFMLRQGKHIVLTLIADADGMLLCGQGRSKVIVHTTTRDHALREYYHNQIMLAKNVYGLIVEASPTKRRRDIPYLQMRGLAETVDLLNDLHHYVQHDDLYGFIDFVYRHRLSHTWQAAPGFFSPPPYQPELDDHRAPEWANWIRLAHERSRNVVEWWIDNRQAENGELGGYYGDDTDFIQHWVDFALLADDDHKIRDSYRLLADYVWNTHMANGLTVKARDHLHTYEEGPNLQGKLGILYYGDPQYVERQMLCSSRYEPWLVAKNPQGQTLFRSWSFGDKIVRTQGAFGYDILSCLIFEPGFYLWWYNGHPGNEGLFKAWMDTWLSAADLREPGPLWTKPLKWETGRPDPPLPSLRGRETFYLCYALGQRFKAPRYFEPFKPGRWALSPAAYVRFRKVLREFADAEAIASRDQEIRRTLGEAADAAHSTNAAQLRALGEPVPEKALSPSVAVLDYHLKKDKRLIPSILKPFCERFSRWRPAYTWLELSPDRIGLATGHLSELCLGGQAGGRGYLYPMVAVTWEGAGTDVARLVIDDWSDRLRVALYSFAPGTKQVTMRVWRLRHGDYRVRIGPDKDDDSALDESIVERTQRLARHEAITLSLPPAIPYLVECHLVRELEPVQTRCDLAVGPNSVRYDPTDDTATITAHSLGCKPTPEARLTVTDGEGKTLLRATVPSLDAPLDFKPRTTALRLTELKKRGVRSIQVQIDPEDQVAEITEANNTAHLALP